MLIIPRRGAPSAHSPRSRLRTLSAIRRWYPCSSGRVQGPWTSTYGSRLRSRSPAHASENPSERTKPTALADPAHRDGGSSRSSDALCRFSASVCQVAIAASAISVPFRPRRSLSSTVRGCPVGNTVLGPDGMPSDDLRPRRLHDDPPAPASDDVAAARGSPGSPARPAATTYRRSSPRFPSVLSLSRPRLRGQPRGERLLADLLANRLAQRSKLAHLPLRKRALVDPAR